MSEIKLFGIVGVDVDFQSIIAELEQADRGEMLTVRIHSEGGSVFDGLAIYEAFKEYDGPKRAVIESLAGSIASYIATAFDEVEISSNGFIMIHEPHSHTGGDAKSHAQTAELLAKLRNSMLIAYSSRMGITADEAGEIMAKETWFDAREALSANLVDSIGEAKKAPLTVSNTVPHRVFASIAGAPAGGVQRVTPKEPKMSESQKPAAATIADIKRILPKAESSFIVECIEKGRTVAEVSESALASLTESNEALKAELDEARAEIETLKADVEAAKAQAAPQAKTGQQPVSKAGTGTPQNATSREVWAKACRDYVSQGMTKQAAACRVNRENPGLREAMLSEVNGN